jgi:hypothetical protein
MRISNEDYYFESSDYLQLSQNAFQDPDTLIWTSSDNASDSYLIEFRDSAADQGYIAISRADATAGNITWTEIVRINFDGTLILPALSASIAAAAADALKIFAKDYVGRTSMAKRDSIDESYLLEGKGFSRIWRQDTQPAGAKLWDIWIDTSGT